MNPNTIAVFCPNWVGDLVMATPIFDCLRAGFPEARLIAVVREYVRRVIDGGPWFDQILGSDDKSLAGLMDLVKELRALAPDMSIVLPNSFRTAFLARLSGSSKVYGYRRNGRSWLLTGGPRPIQTKEAKGCFVPIPMVEYYMGICTWLGLETSASRRPSLFIPDSVERQAQWFFERYGIGEGDRVIGINPGARFGSSKCWDPEDFAALADQLDNEWDCRILLFVGPGEERIADTIVERSRAPIINTGPDRVDLGLLKPLVKRCQLLITNDTGPRHYAVAFGVPVVVIMGPTDPRYTAANLEKTTVLQKDLACVPCHEKVCRHDHECMSSIRPKAVLEACRLFLEDPAES
jgi:heptosyltransferase-2